MHVLLLNAGSSSLKCALMDAASRERVAQASAQWSGRATQYTCARSGAPGTSQPVAWRGHAEAVRRMLDDLAPLPALAAVGHRVVHGGDFATSVQIDADVRARIAALAELAPVQYPPGLETLAAAEARLPDVPHVAVFDTAFHAGLPPVARTYPLPGRWTHELGIRRYGFHGLSHAYCAKRAAELLARPLAELRLVICHLGHGCSAAAVLGGRCIDTTMGFTPLDGLMMATRSGAVDPGIVLHLLRHHGLSA